MNFLDRLPAAGKRGRVLWLLAATGLIISLLTRMALTAKSWPVLDPSPFNLLRAYVLGAFYDAIAMGYFLIPFAIYLALLPERIWKSRLHKPVLIGLFLLQIYIFLFTAFSEWVFWDEFGCRFNFIAVDYLVYTQEVIGNIRESYPVGLLMSMVGLIALALYAVVHRRVMQATASRSTYAARLKGLLVFLLLPVLAFALVTNRFKEQSGNRYIDQLAGNGIYEFFSAFRNNELDYRHFYATLDDKEAQPILRRLLSEPHSRFADTPPGSLRRDITNPGPEKRLNVVLISIESMSADFMGHFGNTQNITPFMDGLVDQSLFFSRLYATGTRTVRGLEALSLALPPTPGQSIVKRPDNENQRTLGSVFADKGYDAKYIYGGYGYFDNMNAYFGGNHYQVVDRRSIAPENIHYENIWGVADEDLFTLVLSEADKSAAANKPFFSHVMTTSNHRPYTYPEGRIDIPSHTSREGAVKYTDWAIHDFIERARKKPWFDNTIFVITADHCASSAGKTSLPVNRYHIPMLIYSPKHVQPGRMDRLMSQIDIAPSLLGMLNFSYPSYFFGYDIFRLEPGRERALIGNYQEVGYLRDGMLIRLAPRRQSQTGNGQIEAQQFVPNFETGDAKPVPLNSELAKEAIAYYQGASDLFRTRGNHWAGAPVGQ